MDDAAALAEIEAFIGELEGLLPHRFEVITALGDGTPIPAEALSEDHSIGLYRQAIPRKMREAMAGFREIHIGELAPQVSLSETPVGVRAEWYLEYPGLRGVRFRAERLQYLEEGWWGVTSEVKYPAATALALLHVMQRRYGRAHLCLNAELPMPLWVRPAPLQAPAAGVEAVVQARGEGRVLFTNIHSECTMEFASQFTEAARGYYRAP
jgi:hypothetical protein